jgi:hypothetical protein
MNHELAKLILETVQIILDTVAIDGVDPTYKMLLECHEGIYDYIGSPHNKNATPHPITDHHYSSRISVVLFLANDCFIHI